MKIYTNNDGRIVVTGKDIDEEDYPEFRGNESYCPDCEYYGECDGHYCIRDNIYVD